LRVSVFHQTTGKIVDLEADPSMSAGSIADAAAEELRISRNPPWTLEVRGKAVRRDESMSSLGVADGEELALVPAPEGGQT